MGRRQWLVFLVPELYSLLVPVGCVEVSQPLGSWQKSLGRCSCGVLPVCGAAEAAQVCVPLGTPMLPWGRERRKHPGAGKRSPSL